MASNFVYANSKTPYIDLYNDYAKEQKNIRDAYRKQIEADQEAAISSSNAQYDNAARQNYINYMQAQKRLPSELNAMGIRGGASESSLLRLGSNYGTNVASNEAARGTALAGLRQTYADKLASYDEENDNKLMQAYLTAVENQLKWEQEQKAMSGGGGGGRGGYGYGYGGGGSTEDSTVTNPTAVTSAMDAYRKANYNKASMNRSTNNKYKPKKNRTSTGTWNVHGETWKNWM